jgi:RNA polymerase sigma-70 factor (ECF subfamily)
MTIAQLIQRSQTGDQSAIQALVISHQREVLRLAHSILDDPAEVEEAAQEAFITALRALSSFRGEASFKTWLFSITINGCRKRLKKRQNRARLAWALQSIFRISGVGPTHPEEIIIRREARTELWKAIAALGEKHRLPIILHYEHGLSVDEIAQTLDLRPGTVLSRLYTGREKLRAALQQDLEWLSEAGKYE